MDIWFGRAHIQQEMSDFEGQCATLSAAFAYAKRDPKKLQWIEGAPLEGDPERVLPEIAQGYLAHYYELETPEGDERFLHLASLIAAAFPRHAYPVNSIGLYYAAKEDWEQALPYFEKAHALDPQDLLIVMNLGVLHAKRHDVAKARPYLETVIGSPSADPQMREDARCGGSRSSNNRRSRSAHAVSDVLEDAVHPVHANQADPRVLEVEDHVEGQRARTTAKQIAWNAASPAFPRAHAEPREERAREHHERGASGNTTAGWCVWNATVRVVVMSIMSLRAARRSMHAAGESTCRQPATEPAQICCWSSAMRASSAFVASRSVILR
jgi:tetratricopeptide (TPR) repeat protein